MNGLPLPAQCDIPESRDGKFIALYGGLAVHGYREAEGSISAGLNL